MVYSDELRENYSYRTELHSHTKPASPCGDILAEDYVKKYKAKGYDSIVMTNHFISWLMDQHESPEAYMDFYLRDYYTAKEFGKKVGLNVILGMEIRFDESFNDYLVFGIDEDFIRESIQYFDKGLEVFYKEMKNDKNVILQAHPFRPKMDPIRPDFVDGIETFNMHPGHNSAVSVAARYAKEHDMLVSCGTDFHHENHEGQAALLTKSLLRDSIDVAEAIKSRDVLFDIGGSIVLPY